MLLFLYLQAIYSQSIDDTIQNIKDRAKELNMVSNSFDTRNDLPIFDKDAISILLENVAICSKPVSNFLNQVFKTDSNELEKCTCRKGIKVKATEANFTFKAMRASIVNEIQFYSTSDDLCSQIKGQFFFFIDGSLVYQATIDNFKYKIRLNQSVTFDKLLINAITSDKSILCLDEFGLFYR